MNKLLLFLLALSLPLGDQLNPILGFSASLVFSFVFVLVALCYKFCLTRKVRFPRSFSIFYLFVILHTLIIYILLYHDSIFDKCYIVIFGNTTSNDTYAVILLRYFTYFLSPILFCKLIVDENHLFYFLKSIVWCFITSAFLSYIYNVLVLNDIRFSGGFHDPNTFGGMSVISMFICFYLQRVSSKKIYYYFALIFLVFVLISESRSSLISVIVGFILLYYIGYINRRVFIAMCFFVGVFFIYMLINDIGVFGRFNDIKSRDDGDLRVVIWNMYLESYQNFAIYGTGVGHKLDAVSWYDSMRATHNMYLLQFVQFGILGLILFISTLITVLKKMWNVSKRYHKLMPLFCIEASILILYCFSDYDNTRDYVIVTMVFLSVYNLFIKNIRYENRNNT